MTNKQKREMILDGRKFCYRGRIYYVGHSSNKCYTFFRVIDGLFDRQGSCALHDDRIKIFTLLAGHIVDIVINYSEITVI